MRDDTKKLREEIEKACDGCDVDRLGSLTIEHQDTILAALRAVEALRPALEHVLELEEAWRTGAIHDRDGKGGERSNRNVDVRVLLSAALASQPTPKGAGK